MDNINDNITAQEGHAIDKLYDTCYYAMNELEALPTEVGRKVVPFTETQGQKYQHIFSKCSMET